MKEPNFERMVCNCLLMALVMMYLLFSCCGCNPAKRLEKKQDKAADIVLASRKTLENKILPQIQKIFPCENDTAINVISDTVTRFDTAYLQNDLQKDYSNGPSTPMYGDPFFPQKQIRVTKTITIHDTSFRYIRDQRAENILEDSLRSAQFNLKVSEGEKEGWKQKAQDRFKALFIVIALFVIGLIIKFYSKNIFSGLKGFITGI